MKNQRKNDSILDVILIILALLFSIVGCERKLTKYTKLKESTEQTQSLSDAVCKIPVKPFGSSKNSQVWIHKF